MRGADKNLFGMRVFVTGATGFIGSYLVKELLRSRHEMLCLKRDSSDLFRLGESSKHVDWVNNSENWHDAFIQFKPEAVFHLAWDGVSSADRIIWKKQVHNIILQQELLDLSLEAGVKKFIGAGSQSEYGDFEGVIDEQYPVCPKTAYAAAKVASLELLKSFCEINQIQWYWFRMFPLFGPYESDRWLIPSLIKAMSISDSMDLTPGEQQLPYLYVGECAKAIASPSGSEGKSGIYNVCADNIQPLKSLVTMIRDKVNPDFKLNFGALNYRYGQSMLMGSNTHKLASCLYKIDTSSFEDRLNETINYYLKLYERNQKQI